MRYLVPALLAAFVLTGCASSQCKHHQKAEPEPAPTSTEAEPESVPLLQDIPLLGFLFKENEPKPVSSKVPMLGDIPLLGRLFERAPSENDQNTNDQGEDGRQD